MRSMKSILDEAKERKDREESALRDEFAKIALARGLENHIPSRDHYQNFSQGAWALADEMMKARTK